MTKQLLNWLQIILSRLVLIGGQEKPSAFKGIDSNTMATKRNSATNGLEAELQNTLSGYSLDDLARSFLILNLWLPNIASPIKIEYLYTALECVSDSLSEENKIHTYDDYVLLCDSLLKTLPDFTALEDYFPEADWGEIRYFFREKFFRIFYGAGLSNQFDFYSAFEVVHSGYDKVYTRLLERSPMDDLEFCLGIQDYIITRLDQSDSPRAEVTPGHIEIPPERFWIRANQFITDFSPGELYDGTQLDQFSYVSHTNRKSLWPSLDSFSTRTLEGKNCVYFFIKNGDKYYPVIPRRFLSVLYDTWGELLKQHFREIRRQKKHIDAAIEIQLCKFLRQRLNENTVFGLVSAINPESQPQSLTFATAICSSNRIILVHVVPISSYLKDLKGYLKELSSTLTVTQRYLSKTPLRLMIWSENKIAEFHPKQAGLRLKTEFIIAIPYLVTEVRSFTIPKRLPGVVLTMDQLLGIIDEIDDPEDLANFLDYREQLCSTAMMMPVTSPLDLFGSYRDLDKVLIPGASSPTHLLLDFDWGSDYRYRSLSVFWSQFPHINFFGHPRGWALLKDGPPNALSSRSFKAYTYYQSVGEAVLFVYCPIHLMRSPAAKITDLVMQSLRDALELYRDELSGLDPFKEKNRIQVYCVPSSVADSSDKLTHLRHLIPNKSLWGIEITRIGSNDYGVTLVCDDQKLTDVLMNASDRSVQVDLLTSVLEKINVVWRDDRMKCKRRSKSVPHGGVKRAVQKCTISGISRGRT